AVAHRGVVCRLGPNDRYGRTDRWWSLSRSGDGARPDRAATQTAAALLRYGASALIRQAHLSQKLLKARLPVQRSILTVDGQVEHVRVRLDATLQPAQCFRPISKSHVDGS